MVERTRTLPGLGLGLGVNPYLDPASLLNPPDPSQDTSVTGNASPAPAGSEFGEGLGSWLGALGMALLSSPRNAPFATLPDILPGVMQQSQLRAAAAQQAKLAQMAPSLFHPQGISSIEDLLGGASPTSPPVSNVGGGQAPQYPSTGSDTMSAGGALNRLDFPTARSFAQQAGFQGSAADTIAATAMAESGGNPFAANEKGEHSYGITQINADAHGPVAREAYGNPLRAMQLAYDVSKGGTDFRPWTMYKNGMYRKYLPQSGSTQGGGLDLPVQLAQASPPTMTDASPQMRPNTFAAPAADGTQSGAEAAPPVAVGDSLTAHLIRKAGVSGQESGRVGVYNPGDTAVAGWTPSQILSGVIPNLPNNQVRGKPVILSTGASNDPTQLDQVPAQIQALKDRGAAAVTVMGVGTAPQLAGVNDQLAQIARQSGAAFAGPLRKVGGDQIHSADPQAELAAIQAASASGTTTPAATAAPAAAAQTAPTPQQVQQAQAFVQRPPPPSPDTVGSDLAKQRAAAIRYYKYYGDLALRLAPFGAAGKPYVDAANKQMDLAKTILTEGQKKQLDATYAFPIAQGTAAGSHAGALPYLPAEKQIEQQAQYFGPGADVGLQQQLDRAKAQEQAAANTQEHMATQYGLQYDPRNPNAGVSPIPNFSALNAANKGAEAASVANSQMPAKVGEQTASDYAKLGAEDIFKRRPLALDAAESLRQSQVARNLIGAGINTGPFAQWKQSFDRVLGDNGVASNTEAFVAARASEVGRLIKQFGSGTGLSDADREYASQMAAGKIGLTKESITKILDLNDRAAQTVLQRYNQDAAQVPGGLVPYPLTVQPAQNTAAAPTSQQQGAAPVAPPPGGVAIGTYQGRPVYRMPDGSRKVLQ